MKKLLLILALLPILAFGKIGTGRTFLAYDDSFNNTTVTSTVMQILKYEHVGIQLIYTGTTIAATCAMEVSNDKATWQEVAGSEVTLTAAGGSDYIDRSSISAAFLRATCTSTDTNVVDMDLYLAGK